MQYLFYSKWGKKIVLVFLEGESIILKYAFTSVVHQLALKSMDFFTNYRKVESGPVCRHLLICKFACRSLECQLEIVWTMFHSLCRKQRSALFVS